MYRLQLRLLQMKNKLNVSYLAESLYRVIQEERIIFREVLVSFIAKKKKSKYVSNCEW